MHALYLQIGKESGELQNEIFLLEKQSHFCTNYDATVAEAQQIFEESTVQEMFQGNLVNSTIYFIPLVNGLVLEVQNNDYATPTISFLLASLSPFFIFSCQ